MNISELATATKKTQSNHSSLSGFAESFSTSRLVVRLTMKRLAARIALLVTLLN
jgi:hypothetical protein